MTTVKGTIGFFGAVDTVTGSNFLFESNGKKIMIDCGLFQGDLFADDRNREKFGVDPASVDVLLVTHAHIDHIGRIPKFVREGFRGKIYSTPPTHDLSAMMLLDTVNILEHEAVKSGKPPIYEDGDVKETMKHWEVHEYYEKFTIGDGITCEMKDAGHILGSAMMFLTLNDSTIVFTGDLGNSPSPLLRDTDSIAGVKYLLMESVYGDRNHEGRDERKEILRQTIVDTISRGGVLMMPTFSIERTQEFLYEFNEMVEHHQIPDVKIYVDSPLAIKATEVYRKADKYYNKNTQHMIKSGDDVFKFPRLYMTETKQESMAIWETKGPKVIMAGSGMMNGGRIVHHVKHYGGDANNEIMLVGYQAVGTPGRKLTEGVRELHLNGEDVVIRAKVSSLHGYSGHKDMDHLIEFASEGKDSLKQVFVAIGEPKSAMFLAQRLRDYVGLNAVVPEPNTTVELEF
jgi:metallo-beta-lactamase family protein